MESNQLPKAHTTCCQYHSYTRDLHLMRVNCQTHLVLYLSLSRRQSRSAYNRCTHVSDCELSRAPWGQLIHIHAMSLECQYVFNISGRAAHHPGRIVSCGTPSDRKDSTRYLALQSTEIVASSGGDHQHLRYSSASFATEHSCRCCDCMTSSFRLTRLSEQLILFFL